ncbi:MAG: alkaline phosphatase family protein [Acidobacteriota bacterium]|nr:alkaline phosphatase family protein [Acidobacteriota bacterium]
MTRISSNAVCGILLALISVSIACGGGSSAGVTATTPTPAASSSIPQFAHVFLIVEENHSYSDVVGNPGMPYFNSLIAKYGLATQYFANTHPSLPNYFMLTTGATIAQDDTFSATVSQDNVIRALIGGGKTWKCYAESLPSAGYLGPNVAPYIRDHNPCTYFSDVINSSTQARSIVPFTHFAADTANATLPDYGLIIPNLQNDAHDCPPGVSSCNDSQKLANTDLWLKNNLQPFLSSSAFANSLVILTFDEGQPTDLAHGGGQVSTIIISPKSKVGYKSTTFFQHESTLRLMMKVLGVTDLPGASAAAPDMGEFFQ